jgi:hypothetical protein
MAQVKNTRSGVSEHFKETGEHLWLFMKGFVDGPEVYINAVMSLLLSITSFVLFCQMKMSDVLRFSDTSFVSDTSTDFAIHPISVVPGVNLTDSTGCAAGDQMCMLSHPSTLVPGVAGIFSPGFVSFNQDEFSIPHLLCVALWFTTPISLFLLANGTWKVFEQWMWWGLYLVIFVWDVFGLFALILVNYTPIYNKILVLVYFLYSFFLIYSVRETWKLRNQNGVKRSSDERGPMDTRYSSRSAPTVQGHSAVPDFMQKLVLGGVTNSSYVLAARDGGDPAIAEGVPLGAPLGVDDGSREALAPEVVTHTFTRTVLLLCEFFFIAPVLYISAFVLANERIIPLDVQMRFWQMSLMFGCLILIEKSRKTRLSYVTDTVLSMAGLVSMVSVSWFFFPDIILFFSGVLDANTNGVAMLYSCCIMCVLIMYANIIVSIVFVMFIGKDTSKLVKFQDISATQGLMRSRDNTGVFQRAVTVMYYVNSLVLCVVKILLFVVFVGPWLRSSGVA